MEVLMREAFLYTDFIGQGLGECSGCGLGTGAGYGLGFGYNDGTGGSDYEYSNDYGYGYGKGYGSGDGYGYGNGNGNGDDFGNCYGLKSLNGQLVDMINGVPTILTHIIGNVAKGFIVRTDFSLAPTFVCKQENTFAHGETLHKAQEKLLEKIFHNMSTEERIAAFCKEFKPGVKRPAMDFFSWHNRLTGSCEKGRREFARQHHIDIENDEMTPEEFFKLTRRYSYGGKIIRQTEHRFASISKD